MKILPSTFNISEEVTFQYSPQAHIEGKQGLQPLHSLLTTVQLTGKKGRSRIAVPSASHHLTGHVKRGGRGWTVSTPNPWECRPPPTYVFGLDHCSSMFFLTQDCPWKTTAPLTLPRTTSLSFLSIKSQHLLTLGDALSLYLTLHVMCDRDILVHSEAGKLDTETALGISGRTVVLVFQGKVTQKNH